MKLKGTWGSIDAWIHALVMEKEWFSGALRLLDARARNANNRN